MYENILKVGAAKLSITPEDDMLPILLSFSGDYYEAIWDGDGLYARSIAIDNGKTKFVFIACELPRVPVPDLIHKIIQEKYKIQKDHILFTVTHNHSAPQPYTPKKGEDPADFYFDSDSDNIKRWTRLVVDRIVDVVGLAFNDLRPAKMGYGEDKSYININRDENFDDGYWMQGLNWEGTSDKTVAAVTFTDYNGKLIGAILNYAVHDVICFLSHDKDNKLKIMCGLAGITCGWLERYFGNEATIIWQAGAAGNQNPKSAYSRRYDINGTMYFSHDEVPGAAYVNAIHIGEQHAVDCLRAINKASPTREWIDITTEDITIYLDGQKFPEDVDPFYNRLMADNLLVSRSYFKPGEKYEKKLAEMIPVEEKVPMWAQLVILGDVAFFGTACELYNEIGLLCKEESPLKHTIITNHIGAEKVGYVLDNSSKDHKVFQSFGQVRAGRSNEIIVNGMLEMFKRAFEK